MQMFTVPQFIDTEDKIIGPVTVRQFIICLAGIIVIALTYKFFDFTTFAMVSIFTIIVCGGFAFVKINGRPFHYFVLNLIQTFKKPKLRIWNHKNPLKEIIIEEKNDGREIQEGHITPPKFRPAGSRLKELALIIDTKGVYKGEEGQKTDIR